MGSNASSVVFGWDFQINAAIVLMLDNIQEVQKVRVEGKTEDIELTLINENMIYSQAKSVVKIDDYRNVLSNFKKALKTLGNAAENRDYDKLIYITNTPNPFNNLETMPAFREKTDINFHDLPEKCKDVISEALREKPDCKIDVSKLYIQVIPFHTNNLPNRYKVVKQSVNEFLAFLDNTILGFSNKILDVWQGDLFKNSSQTDTTITIKKSEFIWPIVVIVSEINEYDKNLQEIDEIDIQEIVLRYRDIINNKVDRFEFATKVISDFNSFQSQSSQRSTEFINSEWESYKDEFSIGLIDDDLIEKLIKIIIYKIISKRYLINSIKTKVKL
ncbi:MAG: hypothetical protein P9M11_11070 [Candidatus Tenebribacter burtonii]|jgi:hypothetical protein|nr:hypothetical protein [Candidatus Tenebribacter burtonii]